MEDQVLLVRREAKSKHGGKEHGRVFDLRGRSVTDEPTCPCPDSVSEDAHKSF